MVVTFQYAKKHKQEVTLRVHSIVSLAELLYMLVASSKHLLFHHLDRILDLVINFLLYDLLPSYGTYGMDLESIKINQYPVVLTPLNFSVAMIGGEDTPSATLECSLGIDCPLNT